MALYSLSQGGLVNALDTQQIINLLTGAMTDQAVTVTFAAGVPLWLNRTGAAAINPIQGVQRGGSVKYYLGLDASDHFAVINAAGNAVNFGLDDTGKLTQHLVAGAGTPALGVLATGIASQSIVGNDNAMVITLTTTASPPGAAAFIAAVTFGSAFAAAPVVVACATAGQTQNCLPYSVTASGFSLEAQQALAASTTYTIAVIAIGK